MSRMAVLRQTMEEPFIPTMLGLLSGKTGGGGLGVLIDLCPRTSGAILTDILIEPYAGGNLPRKARGIFYRSSVYPCHPNEAVRRDGRLEYPRRRTGDDAVRAYLNGIVSPHPHPQAPLGHLAP